MIRQGTCNRCGDCCDSESGFPVDKLWPDSVRNWLAADVDALFPHGQLLGLGQDANGKLIIVDRYGNFTLRGNKIYWRWVSRQGLCTNAEPYDDENTFEVKCPLLLDDTGNGRRECALVGTRYESLWLRTCNNMAPVEFTQAEVSEWMALNPNCSYTWMAE